MKSYLKFVAALVGMLLLSISVSELLKMYTVQTASLATCSISEFGVFLLIALHAAGIVACVFGFLWDNNPLK